ncbi:MAG: hypothetical protein NC390_02475 [Fusobacterium sp.]|nr:hypothetical protein [Fusobacterium sp.]
MSKALIYGQSAQGGGGKIAFTMAEILLSLTIIGVVAAITLPSLTGNINERTWNTQRKALYARMSQAIALMPALNGYGTLDDTIDTAAETFLTAGLSKVLKINNICDNTHLADCGIPSKFTTLAGENIDSFPTTLIGLNSMFNGSYDATSLGSLTYADGARVYSYSMTDTKAAAFETANGESIVTYYNPACSGSNGETEGYYSQAKMCANFIYDLNGTKGPNTVGKDIGFISVLYPSDSVVVAPVLANQNATSTIVMHALTNSTCVAQNSETRMPNKDEVAAIFYNQLLIGDTDAHHYWTGNTLVKDSQILAWAMYMKTGRLVPIPRNASSNVRCVKR